MAFCFKLINIYKNKIKQLFKLNDCLILHQIFLI